MTNEFISSEARRIRKKYHSSDPFEILKAMHVVIVYSDSYPRDGLKGFCTVFNPFINGFADGGIKAYGRRFSKH